MQFAMSLPHRLNGIAGVRFRLLAYAPTGYVTLCAESLKRLPGSHSLNSFLPRQLFNSHSDTLRHAHTELFRSLFKKISVTPGQATVESSHFVFSVHTIIMNYWYGYSKSLVDMIPYIM